jgi:hypothetical protein
MFSEKKPPDPRSRPRMTQADNDFLVLEITHLKDKVERMDKAIHWLVHVIQTQVRPALKDRRDDDGEWWKHGGSPL